jgi:hypothetical protein
VKEAGEVIVPPARQNRAAEEAKRHNENIDLTPKRKASNAKDLEKLPQF